MLQRTGRKVQTPKTKAKAGKAAKKRFEPEELVSKVLEGEKVEELVAYMTPVHHRALADYALERQEEKQKAEKMFNAAKALLMQYGKTESKKDLSTKDTSCKISASSKTEVGTPTQLVKILKKLGKTDLADTVLSVKLGEAKKYLGEGILEAEGFIKVVSSAFGKITIKRR